MKRLAAILVLAAACSTPKAVDSKLRIPSDEGVVTEVSVLELTLDGKRSFAISREVESFTANSHQVTALRAWEGRYVHIGLDKRKQIAWVAGLGIAPKVEKPTIFYTGTFARYSGDYVVFQDGTAQRLAEGVRPDLEPGRTVLAIIDAAAHRATTLRPQSS